MKFIFILLMSIIPFISVICVVLNHKYLKKNRQNIVSDISQRSYAIERTRGSVRQGMNKIKTLDDYYKIEKSLTYPKN